MTVKEKLVNTLCRMTGAELSEFTEKAAYYAGDRYDIPQDVFDVLLGIAHKMEDQRRERSEIGGDAA